MADTAIKKIVRDTVKEELVPVRSELQNIIQILGKMAEAQNKFQNEMHDSFREFQSLIQGLVDPIMGELTKNREEQTVHEGQHEEIYQDVQKLKQIHPNYTHQPLVA